MEQHKKTLLDQLSTLYYRKWLFIIPLMLGTAIGVFVAYRLPEYYSATAVIVADEQFPEQYVAPADRTPFSQRLTAISQQVLSRDRLERIVRDFKLYQDERPGLFSPVSWFLSRFGGEAGDGKPYYDLIEQIKQDLEFRVIGEENRRSTSGGNAFSVTYAGKSPRLAMEVTNTIASLFIKENQMAREQFAEGASAFLGGELEKSKGELDKLEKALKDFKESHMGSLPEQLEPNLRTLDRLQIDHQNITGTIKNMDDRRILLEEQLEMSPNGPGAPSNPLYSELDRLRNDLRALLSMYKGNYPDVVIAKKQIKDIEDQLSNERPGNSNGTIRPELRNPALYSELMSSKSQLATLRQRETEIKKQIKEYQNRVENTPANEQKQADLFRDYKISLQNYQSLLEKKMNAKLSQNLVEMQRGERFRIVDKAILPQRPDRPDKLKTGMIGTMGGAALGTALVFLFEVLTPAFRKPEDFEGIISAPVLASIPVISWSRNKTPARLTVVKGRK